MVGTVEGDRENEFHTRFADYRISGEWFLMGPMLMEFLKAEFNFAPQGLTT
jgi:hypothetical protein